MVTVRALSPPDLTDALALASRHPVENVLLLAKMTRSGLEPIIMGHDVLGAFDWRGRLLGLVSRSNSLNPVEVDDQAIPALARHLGGGRRASSIVGQRVTVTRLWAELSRRWPEAWNSPREFRERQPVLVIDHDPAGPIDPRVTPLGPDLFEPYYAASLAMYTEEVGQNPDEATGGYRRHVDRLLRRGDAYGIWDGRRVVFKADIAVAYGPVCQVGGVWLAPDLRGQGLSEAAMAAVVQLCRRRWPIVSLYVNAYNHRALALYRRLGFQSINEFSTILW